MERFEEIMNDKIIIKGAREHNLKNINLEIPKYKLVVFTGISGSGKSSLAFDTIYAEGQRRYVESLSSYARQFLGIMKKPDVDLIEGLSPSISIDQKSASHNPRSTVGTVTEIYDYLRLLYARVGHPHCPRCGREITHMTKERIVDEIFKKYQSIVPSKIMILSPLIKGKRGEYIDLFTDLKKRGYQRVRIDGKIFSLDEDFVLIKTNKHTIEAVIDRIIIDKNTNRQRLIEAVEQTLSLSAGEAIVTKVLDKDFSFPDKPREMEDTLFSERFACNVCGIAVAEIEPRLFSFNSPQGACTTCHGLGIIYAIDEQRVLNPELTISEGGIFPYQDIIERETWFGRTVRKVFSENNIPMTIPLKSLSSAQIDIILHGTGDKMYEIEGYNRFGEKTKIFEVYNGVVSDLLKKFTETESELIKREVEKFMIPKECETCHGKRLKKDALSVTINNESIIGVSEKSISGSLEFIENLPLKLSSKENEIARMVIREVVIRLKFLVDVGLSYLTLARSANTLSGGEAQRIRLASQIGSGLSGVLYVLDEPSIGLHPRDNTKLINTLKKLRDLGNSIIVVEHDRETMLSSDYLFDIGPGAGVHGGEIIAFGTPSDVMKDLKSITGPYLTGKKTISYSSKPNELESENELILTGVRQHNLKNITVSFPLSKLICITGVSGSGKSTLVNDVLYHALAIRKNPFHKIRPGEFDFISGDDYIKRVFLIDQSPIGRTPRSNPVTYTGAFSFIRELFASTRDARLRGYTPGRFSFNVKGGRCETCEGEGQIKIEMQFLPDVYVDCETCLGRRYTQETLDIEFEGKNIYDVLNMTVEDALSFFSFHPRLSHKLSTISEVGLSYIKLGQSAPTLSGGEAQRIKLASELSKKGGGSSLYLLDEPTTGLHFSDIEKLIQVLRKLVSRGNTVIVIEHNLDVIKNADYIIDLGPEGGDDGGKVIAEGKLDQIINSPSSYTGFYLKKVLSK